MDNMTDYRGNGIIYKYILAAILKGKVEHQNNHKIEANCDPFPLQHYEFPAHVSPVKLIQSSNA